MDFTETRLLLSASILIEYWYCPRFVYFMKVLQIKQHEEKRLKVRTGRDVHQEKSLQPEYLRKKLGVVKIQKNVYLADSQLGICGILDEILFFEDNSMSLLDYKFAFNKHKFQTQFLQSVFYSLLLQSNYQATVDCCYIVYTREKNKLVKYPIEAKDRKEVQKTIEKVHQIISRGYYPSATKNKKRCADCTYRKICVQ